METLIATKENFARTLESITNAIERAQKDGFSHFQCEVPEFLDGDISAFDANALFPKQIEYILNYKEVPFVKLNFYLIDNIKYILKAKLK